jgi:cell wall-associated NlpC family hydrolase
MNDVPAWVAGYIGIPFVERGRGRDGADCWGLARMIWAERFGLDLASFDGAYETTEEGEAIGRALTERGTETPEWLEVAPGAERAGDGVLMTGFYRADGALAKAPIHVGVVVAPGALIHIERGTDAALGRYRDDRRLARRVVGFWRHHTLA